MSPVITRASEEPVEGTEGCLSIPGFAGDVDRLESITLRGQNRFGKPLRIKADGWLSRIFQHEIDHLDGILFTDRAKHVFQLEEEVGQAVLRD